MDYIPCCKRRFPYRNNLVTFYAQYFRWLRHLSERFGDQNILPLWRDTFSGYHDRFLMRILSTGWHAVETDQTNQPEAKAEEWIEECFPSLGSELSSAGVRYIIEYSPPIPQIKMPFSNHTMEKEISAYDALHIRFDGFACLAEALIEKYGKHGELIVYDLVVEELLASGGGETGSIEEFVESHLSVPDAPNLWPRKWIPAYGKDDYWWLYGIPGVANSS